MQQQHLNSLTAVSCNIVYELMPFVMYQNFDCNGMAFVLFVDWIWQGMLLGTSLQGVMHEYYYTKDEFENALFEALAEVLRKEYCYIDSNKNMISFGT